MSNSFTALGRLVADPELKDVGESQVLEFRFASDTGFGDNKTTNWLRCSYWGRGAAGASQHLSKGSQIVIYGELKLREYEKDGVKRISPEVRVSNFDFAGSKPEASEEDAF